MSGTIEQMCGLISIRYQKVKSDAGRGEFSVSRNQSTSSSTVEPLCLKKRKYDNIKEDDDTRS